MVEVARVGSGPRTSNPGDPVQVEVRLFAQVREAVGRDVLIVALSAGATARDLLDALCAEHPGIARHRRSLAVAVNLTIVDASHALRSGDEVALLPPVGGG